MSALPMDTHKIVKRLKEAGFNDPQAETVTDVLRENRDSDLGQFVTKEYVHSELVQLEQRLIIKLGSMLVLGIGVVATLVKLL